MPLWGALNVKRATAFGQFRPVIESFVNTAGCVSSAADAGMLTSGADPSSGVMPMYTIGGVESAKCWLL